MAQREVLALNESIPRLEVPQTGDTYLFPVDVEFSGDEIRLGNSANSNTRYLYFIPTGGSTANSSYIASGGSLTVTTVNSADNLLLNAGGDLKLISRNGISSIQALNAGGSVVFKDPSSNNIFTIDSTSMNFYSIGALQWTFDSTGLTASNANGPKLVNGVGSNSAPNLLLDKTDSDTGLWGAANKLNIACGGLLALELSSGYYGATGTVIHIPDLTTAPTSNPGSGGLLYAEAGALKWRSSNGTISTIATA